MRDGNSGQAPIFAATLTPHRSLGPTGFVLVVGLFGFCSFVAGVIFWLAGAWPVMGILGLDVALLYVAFRLSYRSGRAFEEVEVTHDRLTVRKVDGAGRAREFTFNPYWARLEVVRSPAFGITSLRIIGHGQRLALGAFLNPDDRESFATAFGTALMRARSRVEA